MTVDQQAIQDRVIAEHAHEVHTTADAIKVSILVGEAIDAAYNEPPVPHTRRVARSGADFTEGLVAGYLTYFNEYRGEPLLDLDIFTVLRECLADKQYSDRFNAGWCVSFIEALLEDRDPFAK